MFDRRAGLWTEGGITWTQRSLDEIRGKFFCFALISDWEQQILSERRVLSGSPDVGHAARTLQQSPSPNNTTISSFLLAKHKELVAPRIAVSGSVSQHLPKVNGGLVMLPCEYLPQIPPQVSSLCHQQPFMTPFVRVSESVYDSHGAAALLILVFLL